MKSLVGFTGFVGSNLADSAKFDALYNSKNIAEAYGSKTDLLVYAGVPATKYLANSAPNEDLAVIRQAEENIRKISPKKLVLISTIDVFPTPVEVYETTTPPENEEAYGKNRRELEIWVRDHYPDALIVRLPALYGMNLKKNFIYDMLHPIPFRLTEKLLVGFIKKEPQLSEYYHSCGNGFFERQKMDSITEDKVEKIFGHLGFSSLNFTDSRNSYQFYPLNRLWSDISIALEDNLTILHLATEPVTAGELYKELTGEIFINEFNKTPAKYDYRTVHGKIFGQNGAYLMDKRAIIADIGNFIDSQKGRFV